MTRIRSGVVGVAVIGGLFFGMVPSAEAADPVPTAAERSACTSDAFRMCFFAIPNQTAVIACLKSKKLQLSPLCKQLFDRI
ncbi:MAG TPA: hypothetical protein VH678_25090 [Xanthobacteraceae bacterium]